MIFLLLGLLSSARCQYFVQPQLTQLVPVSVYHQLFNPYLNHLQVVAEKDNSAGQPTGQVAHPLRESVESQPSDLFKATTRIADIQNSILTKTGGCAEGTYKPHNDCSNYYFCVHGKWTSYTCPNGLHWNRDSNVCDFPDNVDCSGDSSASVVETQPESEESSSSTASSSTTVKSTTSWSEYEYEPWQPPTPAPRPDYDNR